MPALADVRDNLRAAFPTAPIGELTLLDMGFGSIVVETGDLVFRVARHQDAGDGYAVEFAALPRLASRLPAAMPVPAYFTPGTDQLLFGAIGYKKIIGCPGTIAECNATTASDIADFLAALHSVPVADVPGLPLPETIWRRWEKLREMAVPTLSSLLSAREQALISGWWDKFLADARMRYYNPVIRHGDLWYGNLLLSSDSHVLGVLDWEAVALADPAQDLATQYHMGAEMAGRVIDRYREQGNSFDMTTEYRVRRLWELREFQGVPAAIAFEDSDELEECVTKLRAGPILS